MSTTHNIPSTPLFCYNCECNNQLTAWELRRKHEVRVSRWWFCHKCRTEAHRKNIYILCAECNVKFIFNNNQKYCDHCAKHARGRDWL